MILGTITSLKHLSEHVLDMHTVAGIERYLMYDFPFDHISISEFEGSFAELLEIGVEI